MTLPALPPEDHPALVYDLRIDGAVTAASAAALLTSEILKPELAPSSCRWCAPGDADASVRDALRWSHPKTAGLFSDVGAYALAPLSALGLTVLAEKNGHDTETIWVDALVIAESGLVAMDFSQATKFAVGRARPYAYAGTALGPDDNLSFFSGHATLTFALATASGTVASMRGYRLAPVIWATGMTLATATSYLRIAADKHYLSDVLVGALTGVSVGFVVPYVFHAPRARGDDASAPRLGVTSLRGGSMITLSGPF